MPFGTHLWLAQAEVSLEISSPGFSLQPIGEDFVINVIKRIKPNKATGPDEISARLLKDSVHAIAPSLTMLFNLAPQTGSFPSTQKNARVVPCIRKMKDKTQQTIAGQSQFCPL